MNPESWKELGLNHQGMLLRTGEDQNKLRSAAAAAAGGGGGGGGGGRCFCFAFSSYFGQQLTID